MIITRLAGGIGNQMFHYAVARGYQRSESEKIILDDRLLQDLEHDIEKIIQRPFALNVFKQLKADVISSDLNKLLTGTDFYNRIRRKIFKRQTSYVRQHLMVPVPFSSLSSKNIFLIGNFQSELYFKSIKETLIQDFAFPQLDEGNNLIRKEILTTPNALSLHIRRGDYLSTSNSNIFTSVNLEYYHNAIDMLQAKLGTDAINTFVFTDDINWVKQNFLSEKLNITFVEGNYGSNSWKDMFLMSCCQHHIIANSSFSWWGAWLSQRDGLNLAPKYWFRPNSYEFDINNIVPESWIIVDYNLES